MKPSRVGGMKLHWCKCHVSNDCVAMEGSKYSLCLNTHSRKSSGPTQGLHWSLMDSKFMYFNEYKNVLMILEIIAYYCQADCLNFPLYEFLKLKS